MSGRNRSWFQQRFNGFLTALIPQGSKAKSTTAQSRASMESVLFPSPQSTLKRPWTPPEPLPKYSTPPVPNSAWCSQSFMMGAGMVILQPSTDRVVVVHDSVDGHWFLPRGRKDIGESLEKTALREAYEESGYEVEFLPLHIPSCAPPPPGDPEAFFRLNTEPIFMTVSSWAAVEGEQWKYPGEYLTSWYVGQIPADAIYRPNTGMSNEKTYSSHLFTFDEAMQKLHGSQKRVLEYVWDVYRHTRNVQEERRQEQERRSRKSNSRRSPRQST